MKNFFTPLVVMAVLVSLVGCSSEQETMSSKETVANTVKTDSLDTSLLTHKASDIGNGWAFGQPLNSGVNYRLTDIVYEKSYLKFEKIAKPWFPSPISIKDNFLSYSDTFKSNSLLSIEGLVTVAGDIKKIVSGKVSVRASQTYTNEIVEKVSFNMTVPAQHQVQVELHSIRQKYTGILYQITVIGNSYLANEKNKTLIIKTYRVKGDRLIETKEVGKRRKFDNKTKQLITLSDL